MKILYVAGNTVSGGADAHLRSLLAHLAPARIQPVVLCAYDGPLFEWLTAAGIESAVLPLSYDRMDANQVADAADRIASMVSTHAFDLVHTHLMPAEVCAAFACALVDAPPLVSTIHEMGRHRGQARLGARLKVTYICVCEAVRANLVEQGVPLEMTVVIHNDVDTDAFNPRARDDAFLRRLGYGPQDFVVLTVARLSPEKNLDVVLQSARTVSQIVPTVRWLVVGEGPEGPRLEQLAREEGLDGIVRFHEAVPREQLPAFFANAHAHVLPSLSEAFPLVTLEALACATPVIVTAVGGNGEVVVEGRNGLIVPPGDPRALADAVVSLARDPSNAQCLGRLGRVDVETRFAAPRMAEAVAAVYSKVLERRGAVSGKVR